MKKHIILRQKIINHFPHITLAMILVLLVATAYYANQWRQADQLNKAYQNESMITQSASSDNYLQAYSIGYLLAKDDQAAEAAKAFDIAEATADPHLRALAKYAIANLHAYAAVDSIDEEHGSRRLVERILLAREAYKGALRLEPKMYQARFNLELLDRLSPEKRTTGASIDWDYSIGLDPFQQSGRALMKDNTRRGLP